MHSGVNSYARFFFVHLVIIFILLLGFYSDLPRRVRTVYLFNLCVVSLLSSKFALSALVWFPNFKYLALHCALFICKSSWILWLIMYQGAFRRDWRVLD
jgi:hypothetical protein